jgi:hypothetical protein
MQRRWKRGENLMDFDFLPPGFHEHRARRDRDRRRAILVLFMVVLMGGWWVMYRGSWRRAEARWNDIRVEQKEIEFQRNRWLAMQVRLEELSARQQLLASLDDPASFTVVLAQLAEIMPVNLALTEISFTLDEAMASGNAMQNQNADVQSKTPTLTHPKGPLDRLPLLSMAGVAADAAVVGDFLASLASEPYFADMTTRYPGEIVIAGRAATRFEVSTRLLPQREVKK